MNDLIKRSDAIEVAIAAADEWDGGYNNSRAEIIRNAMNSILPVTGHWIPVVAIEEKDSEEFPPKRKYVEATNLYEVDALKCSECEVIFDFDDARYYCHNCGAKMTK